MTRQTPDSCPCDPIRSYSSCCGRWHAGLPAPDAESLMRSRYSAYVLGLSEYIRTTWHASTRPDDLDLDEANKDSMRWLGLSIRQQSVRGTDRAEVEFIARYRVGGGRAQRLHEISRFVREGEKWFYLDGDLVPTH